VKPLRTDGRPSLIEGIDGAAAVRGASTGFSVMVAGGLLAPIVAGAVPPLGAVWLTSTAVIAFVVSAGRIGQARFPAVHGAAASVCSYLLVLPLVLMNPAGNDIVQIATTAGTAVGVGALVGFLRGRRRGDNRSR
jgi:hypothetical protein